MAEREETAGPTDEAYDAVIATYRVIKNAMKGLVSDEALTQPQFQALKVIAKDGAMLMRELSAAMLVSPANVTGIVDRLEGKRLIRRTAREGDRRATMVELTPEGRAVQGRVALRQAELVQRALGAFTPAERKALCDLLGKLQRELTGSIGEG
ncbi:MAG: MarR family transcriptional regulator [Nitrososphaerales archaeon]|jgi:DNA-binding MarR family transcriptional regulator